MKNSKESQFKTSGEVNLKMFFQKILRKKWFFVLSIGLCMAAALAYIKTATPQYEASTSILIDVSGNSRALGDSKYGDGGVGLIDVEKNLYNEIGIIKSFSLIKQTVEDLGYEVSYYKKNLIKTTECYGYFPFVVELDSTKSQLYNVPFEIELRPNDKFVLRIESSGFAVSNPSNGSTRSIDRDFSFSEVFNFGEQVNHGYFNFTLKKPEYSYQDKDFEDYELSFVVHDMSAVAGTYASKIDVGNIDIQASIFKIASPGPVVSKEIDFLTKLTENYIQNKLVSRNKIASAKEDFIKNQLKDVADSLKQVELVLEKFKKEKRALNLSETASNALGRTSNLQMDKAKIRLNIKYYNSLILSIEENRKSENFVIPTATGIDDPLINENLIELKRLYADRSRKKFYVTETNEQMNILNNQIQQSTDLLLNNLRSSVKSSEYTLQRVDSQISSYDGVIRELPNQENELLTIQRKTVLYQDLFKYLSEELAKSGIAGAENTSDTRVLDEARMVGSGPIFPNKKLILMFGLLAGCLIPLAWIILFSSKDTIENLNQIVTNTDIPVIASIVHHETTGSKSKSELSLWKLKESFRDLSTNLRFVGSNENSVIGITSIMPEEGKTYNAINLGITFAEAGKKTLIIDADLRNPSLVNRVHNVEGKGLYNYLRGEINMVNDMIYPHEDLRNLNFIPTSLAEGNVHELISSSRMKNLVQELKSEYDYIIIDTPAAGLVSDFVILSELMDINLFVVRRKIAKIKFLQDIENLFSSEEKKNYIIFNDVPKEDYKYGYEEKYGRNKEVQIVNKSLSI